MRKFDLDLTRFVQRKLPGAVSRRMLLLLVCGLAAYATPKIWAREKDAAQYGAGLIVNVPYAENQVLQVVQDVAQNGIIRGTKEYSKDEYVSGASVAPSTRAFPESSEGGKVFYKVKLKALDPQNFKDTSDVGTLAVRYVVQAQDDKHTVIRIDARFVEDYRRMSHASNGSVEGAEYQTIHDRLEAIELMKKSTAEAEKDKQELATKSQAILVDRTSSTPAAAPMDPTSSTATSVSAAAPAPEPPPSSAPPQSLEQRVQSLRRQVERLVKSPGAPLKSAPFRTASTLQSLPAGAQVLVEISTPYWVGVETHEGQHGWVLRDNLELLP